MITTLKQKNKSLGVLFIILSAFCFSLMSLFVRLSGDLPVFQKVFFRNLIATFISFFVLLKTKDFKVKKGNIKLLAFRIISGMFGIIFNFYAISTMSTYSDATILNKLAPFFAVVFSIFILKEKTKWFDWLILVFAFAGAVLIAKPSLNFTESIPSISAVLGALFAGLAYTIIRRLGFKGERSAIIVFYYSLVSTIIFLPMMLLTYEPMTKLQLLYLLLTGVSACGGQLAVTKAYTYAPAKEISVFDYSQVLFAAILGIFVLSEFPDTFSIIGYIIIILSAVAIDGIEFKN